MYQCHVRFYFIGGKSEVFDAFENLTPFEAFSHDFTRSDTVDELAAANADVIVADLSALNLQEALHTIIARKKPGAELIVIAAESQRELLTDCVSKERDGVDDIWISPMPAAELSFRTLKWQREYKNKKDAWQTDQYLEAVINSSPDLVWYKTKDGIHEKVNDSFCATVGKTKEQVQGQGHAYIWNVESDDPACIESERIVMESKKTCVSEEIIQTGDEKRTLSTYKSPLYDIDGSVMGTVGIAIDITKERTYARELMSKNQTLESIFSAMECGIVCHTLDGSRVLSINKAALRILGYESKEEFMKEGFFIIAPSVMDSDRERVINAIQSLKNVGDSVNIEYRVKHSDGKIIDVMGTFKLMEENGEIYCQRLILDYTAHKMQEEMERHENERKQMELIHALSIDYNLVCYFDLDTGLGRALRIGYCKNGILEEIFSGELCLEECLERYIETGVNDEDKENMLKAVTRQNLREQLSAKPVYHSNYRTECCGETKYFQMKVVRAGDWSRNCGIVLGFRSVDEETREEREKKAILEDALSQANRANQAKTTFLSNMSHDIRTPMNAIIGFTTLAMAHIDNKEQIEEYLKKIMTSGNHLLSLINDILDMSRIENGKINLDEHPCSLPEILHDLRNIIQADIHTKQLDLYMDAVDVQNEEICCDRLRLNQVLLNLLSNAIKYTPAGGTVSMKIVEKPGAPAGCGNYEFHVKDNGIGMSEEFVSHIFEPFERERNSTISGIQGTGLGMAITKSIVDMMNGSINVKSKQGVGTECVVSFTFRLSSEKKEPMEIPELKNLRALVVDDDFNTCDSVTCMLQQIGMRAEWTMSGKEAVLRTRQANMRNDHYFVYVIDWLLPDMNGVEVARRIRKEMGQEVPIIVITAYDWADIEAEAREAGVTAFCAKPLFISELRGCLKSILCADSEKTAKAKKEKRVLHSERILLAEDNELNREIATAILEEEGFKVEVAENGQIAVDMLKNSEPGYYRLILMDIQMPVMNGYEATKTIRALEDKRLADIPILAMTANAFEEDKREAMHCGMNGHIAKPIDIAKLIDTLEQVLE